MTGASDQEAREFADAFRTFLMWVHAAQSAVRNGVAALVGEFIGDGVSDRSVVSRSLRSFEHVNLQTELDAWSCEPGREVAVHGISVPPHHGAASLQQIIAGDGIGQLRLSAPALIDLPNGPGSTLACLQFAVLLVSDPAGRYVVLVSGPMEQHEPTLTVEIAGLPVDAAQAVHAQLDQLRSRLNVYRGHVLDVSLAPGGGVSLTFTDIPVTAREDVVLPEAVLSLVERHALSVAEHREALLAAGQHLKRGAAAVRPAGDRQDTHDAVSDRQDGQLHPADPDRRRAARDWVSGRARTRAGAGGDRA